MQRREDVIIFGVMIFADTMRLHLPVGRRLKEGCTFRIAHA